MKIIASAVLALCMTAAVWAQEPKALAVEELGAPVTTMESASFTAYSAGGAAHHLIFFHPMRNPIECQVRIIDLKTGAVTEASGPADRPLRMIEHEGKFYFSHYGRCGLWVFDPATMKIEYKAGPDLGRSVMFQIAAGANGRIYMGTSSGCEVVEYDPKSDTFHNFGRQGPKIAGPRYVYSMGVEEGWVYSAAGKNPWYLVALNVRTGEQKVLLSEPKYLNVRGGKGFCAAEVTTVRADGKDATKSYALRDGALYESAAYAADAAGNACILAADKSAVIVLAAGARKTVSLAGLPAEERDFTQAAGGPAGHFALARKGVVALMDLKSAKPAVIALPDKAQEVSAMAWTQDGTLLVGLQGSNGLFAVTPSEQELRQIATLPEVKTLLVKRILADGGFAYVGAANPEETYIVDLRAGKVTAAGGDGRLAKIYGKIYTGEKKVTLRLGASTMAPARIRLEDGAATPDTRYENFDLRHNDWVAPEVIMDTVQLDGSVTIHYRMIPSTTWQKAAARIHALPVKIEALHVLPDGRILGTTRRYQEAFAFNPADGKFELFGKFHLSGSMFATVGGLVYIAGYPGIHIVAYDPAKPWTLGMSRPDDPMPAPEAPNSNPRALTHAGEVAGGRMPAHYPCGMAIGADGCIYIGGHCERGAVGGALGWLDPKTESLDALPRDPFLVLDCAGLAAADDGRKIVYSSHVVADPAGKTPTPKEAKLFVLDTATRQIVSDYVPFPGGKSTGVILARGQKVYGFLRDRAYLFDLKTGKVEKEIRLTAAPYGPVWGPDGQIYVSVGDALNRMNPETLEPAVLGALEKPGHILFLGKDLYLAGRPELRRIRGAVEAK